MDIPALFHISFQKLSLTLSPRQPYGSELQTEESSKDPDAWIFAEFQTPRISFAPTIFQCVQAIYPNTHQLFQSEQGLKEGLEFQAYRLDPKSHARFLSPHDLSINKSVWDAHITDEWCALDPVKIYWCGTFNAKVQKGIKGFEVYPFDDRKMKKIKTIVPKADEITFKQTFSLRGDMFKLSFFSPLQQ